MVLTKAVFLDKDGTLIKDVPYNVDPKKIELSPTAPAALKLFHQLNYRIFVISNQSGIAHEYFREEDLEIAIEYIGVLFRQLGVPLDDFYYCPHRLEDNCQCRKPNPGMIFRAQKDYSLDLKQSWFVGDILHDIEAGRRAGCRTILIDNGNETEWDLTRDRLPHHFAANLEEASRIVAALENRSEIKNEITPNID